MVVLYLDFETRSTVDLKVSGLDNYARHPSTDVWCMGYAFDDEPTEILVPDHDSGWHTDQLTRIICHLGRGGIAVAHNSAFELAIWRHIMVPRYGWPELKAEQCRDTMCMSYAMAMPGALENAAPAAGIQHAKDMAGHRLMLQMAKPREIKGDKIIWWDEPEKLKRLYEYCKQDVEVERALYKRLMPLSESEQALWVLDQQINNRGIYIDQKAVAKAIELVQAEQDRLNKEMRRVTGNFVGFCTEVKRLTDWVRLQGVPVDGLAKADVLDALANQSIPGQVREALLIRQEAGKSSTAKLNAMLQRVSADGRVRGTLQYHGAAPGRWTGRGIQVHNFPRGKLLPKEVDEVLTLLGQGAFA